MPATSPGPPLERLTSYRSSRIPIPRSIDMRRQLITRLAAGVLLLAGLTAGSVPAFAGTSAPAFKIAWTPCEGAPTVQCGTLQVPLDWSRPNGQRVPVAVARHPAESPAARIGTLFFNPGGPGDGAAKYIVGAENYFSPTLRARFDLVAMDPRGMGNSVQVRCGVDFFIPESTLFPRSEEQFQQMVRHNREFGQSCLQQTGALMRNIDTAVVARDHEALRIALGVDKVSWLGVSYGAQLAANYANEFPRHTRAMVIDAALDHSQAETPQAIDEIMSVEDGFNRFARWCDTAPDCALRGQDVASVFDALVARADAHHIPVEGSLRPDTGEYIRMGTKSGLAAKDPVAIAPGTTWPNLSQMLAAALAGDASPFMLFPAGVPQDGLGAISANACTDYVPQVETWAEMQQRMQLGRQLAPHMQGASDTWRVNGCIGWPVKATNPPRALDVRGVPTLLVHAVHDPQDPYRWTHNLAAQIHGSDLLTRTGDGHTSYYSSPCSRAAMDDYLVRPQAPADRVCDE
jgi:pimeloyl-ACP methyl ester carboxylesterase